MVDKELIENWRTMVKLPISSLLFKNNYEGMGEQDKEEFERNFDEILDLALIGLKHKEQFSQEGTTKDATSDTISRQAAIDALDVLCQEHRYKIPGKRETYSQYNEAWQDALDRAEGAIFNLPSAQPEVIRCKDCKHLYEDNKCPLRTWWTHTEDDYCSYYVGIGAKTEQEAIEAWNRRAGEQDE